MSHARWFAMVSLVVLVGCGGAEKPLATYGDDALSPEEFLSEMDFVLDEGQTLDDLDLTPETLLRRVVRMKLLKRAAERSVDRMSERDVGRLELYQESLFRDALLQARFPEPIEFEEAEIRRRYEASPERDRVPYEEMRQTILQEMRDETTARRMKDMEAELLSMAEFTVDSVTVEMVAVRFAAHRDSLRRMGADPRSAALPLFTTEEKDLPYFSVLGQDFTVGSLVMELSAGSFGEWASGTESETLYMLARRRALSAIIGGVARQRGLLGQEEIARRISRKRDELLVNAMLRELWRGLEPSDDEIRERLAAEGQTRPDPEVVDRIRAEVTRQRQARKLDEYLGELEQLEEVRYFPERLPAVLSRRPDAPPPEPPT